ncbi:MAG TPA: FAD-dependent oxidoreductase [Aestuariivirgaceae bacterium]|nr:FAD-dependent oxidoreductase [Aestuariivirgaceae bacterium]
MKSHYRVVIVGGGVVGASIAYHLTRLGWADVAILERSVLTAGSSWHAAGGYHALNADPNIASLQAYTIDVLSRLEQETGHATGIHMTGGITFACTQDRWEWLQAAYRVFQTMGIEDVRLMSPDEIEIACPIISTEGIFGGMWADREGYVDTTGVVQAYAKGAKQRGAEVIEHNRVIELKPRRAGGWDVVTEKGTITAEHVVNAAGLWAKQVGRMVGLDLPVSPLAHHYLVTETVPELAALDFEVPMMVDLDGFTYARQDQKGMLVGIYEVNHKHWNMDGAPWDYGFDLIPPELDRIENELTIGFSRYPALERAGIKRWVNGPFTFTPDGNPLVGPVHGLPGYWLACGVMAGFLQGGGVGKSLAEWMITGEPVSDIYGMDVARYGDFASNREYIRQMTGQFYSRRFVMTYPNEQLWAGRPLKTCPSYQAMTAHGARWGVSWGLEVPIYFAPKDFVEIPTLKRSNAFAIIGEECRKTREGVGIVDTSGFSRFEVTGRNAAAWLDRMMASRLPRPGRCRLAPMLSPTGRLKGDLTLFNWGDGSWWIMGSYYLRQWHMRWFLDNLEDGVSVRDISDAIVGFALAGPKSRELLESLASHDLSNASLPFMGCAEFDVGLIRAKVGRLSVEGELGYELNCSAAEHATLYLMLKDAGRKFDAVDFGFNAMNSMRLEKSFGIWSREFMQGYTPGMTRMDRWIDWQKEDFIGRKTALAERDGRSAKQLLVTLEIDAADADATGYEPIWIGGRRVGYVTSGGYGYHVGKSLALALIDRGHAAEGTELAVHVVGVERKARIIADSPHDPTGARMRG